jgi:SAM-dependent methyltransferase
MTTRQAMLALLTVTFALLVNEIMLSAIFNVTIGAINTVVAISAALLGLSSAGIVVYVSPRLREQALDGRAIHLWLAVFVLATLVSVLVIMNLPVSHADFSYAPAPWVSALGMVSYLAAILPFFAGGMCVSLILLGNSARIGELYFADLLGASLGCVAAVVLLPALGAPRAILYATAPALLVAAYGAIRDRPVRWGVLVLLLLPLAIVETTSHLLPLLRPKRFSTFGRVEEPRFAGFNTGRGALEFERWSPDAWTIIRSESIPQQWQEFRGWGVSSRYRGPVPRLRQINYNLRFSTYATEWNGRFDEIGDWLDSDLISLHYLLGRRYPHVLNIGAGGGREVLNALHHDSEQVTAVDISDVTINEIMRGHLREFSGDLYFQPKVHAYADEGRSFVARSDAKYDLIDFTIVGGVNSEKLDVMHVDDLFTLEALRTYWSRLRDGGVFSYVMYNMREDLVSEWARNPVAAVPYIPAMKTVAGSRTVFEEGAPGGRFADHLLVAGLRAVIDRNYDLVHVIVSTTPFTAAERARFAELCASLGFRSFYPADADNQGNLFQRIAEADSLAAFDASLPFSITPATDDHPFQYAFRWRTAGEAVAALLANPVVSTGMVFGGLAVLLCFGPLMWGKGGAARRDLQHQWRLLGFFACIGAGYMVIEIAVLLKIQLYLGHPVLALSVALFSFLLASGLGSRATRGVPSSAIARVLTAAVVVIIVYGLVLRAVWPLVFAQTLGLGTTGRALVAVAAMAPLAFAMGMLLPLGVRILGAVSQDFLPWAWAANGCFSVFGIFVSRVAGLFWGFDRSLLIGFGLYVLATACALAQLRFLQRSVPVEAPARASLS